MRSVADNWWAEDRRDLFRSLEVIVSDNPNPDRIGLCLDTILNDLELYDDPLQGRGSWLFDNELDLADAFSVKLKATVTEGRLIEAGPTALTSNAWPEARATAAALLRLMAANGDFTRRMPAKGLSRHSQRNVDETSFAVMSKGWITVGVLVLAGLLAVAAYIRLSPAIAQDACLDGGGAWRDGQCVGRRPGG